MWYSCENNSKKTLVLKRVLSQSVPGAAPITSRRPEVLVDHTDMISSDRDNDERSDGLGTERRRRESCHHIQTLEDGVTSSIAVQSLPGSNVSKFAVQSVHQQLRSPSETIASSSAAHQQQRSPTAAIALSSVPQSAHQQLFSQTLINASTSAFQGFYQQRRIATATITSSSAAYQDNSTATRMSTSEAQSVFEQQRSSTATSVAATQPLSQLLSITEAPPNRNALLVNQESLMSNPASGLEIPGIPANSFHPQQGAIALMSQTRSVSATMTSNSSRYTPYSLPSTIQRPLGTGLNIPSHPNQLVVHIPTNNNQMQVNTQQSSAQSLQRSKSPRQEQHSCRVCKKHFDTIETLCLHTRSCLRKVLHRCNKCNAHNLNKRQLKEHMRMFHNELETGSEMVLPVVNVRLPGVAERLVSLGAHQFVPLLRQKSQQEELLAIPIITIDGTTHAVQANLGGIGISQLLQLGPLKVVENECN